MNEYYPDGRLKVWSAPSGAIERRCDDETRAVYDGQGTKLRDYTAAENQAADAELEAEARFVAIEDRLAALEAHAWPAQPDPTDTTGAPTWADYNGIAPAGALLLDGGKVWRNVSGVPLAHPPSGFPGWTPADLAHLWALVLDTPDPDPDPDPDPGIPEWSASAEYAPGDLVTRNGVTYRCLTAHGAAYQGTWGPPAAGVWELA